MSIVIKNKEKQQKKQVNWQTRHLYLTQKSKTILQFKKKTWNTYLAISKQNSENQNVVNSYFECHCIKHNNTTWSQSNSNRTFQSC